MIPMLEFLFKIKNPKILYIYASLKHADKTLNTLYIFTYLMLGNIQCTPNSSACFKLGYKFMPIFQEKNVY